jgi:hypothetical protein
MFTILSAAFLGLGGLVRGFMVGAITFAVGQLFFLSSKRWPPP